MMSFRLIVVVMMMMMMMTMMAEHLFESILDGYCVLVYRPIQANPITSHNYLARTTYVKNASLTKCLMMTTTVTSATKHIQSLQNGTLIQIAGSSMGQ